MRALVAELRDDLEAVARLVVRLDELRARIGDDADPEPTDVMGAAGFLHHVYTGMESVHERIVRLVDGTLPAG